MCILWTSGQFRKSKSIGRDIISIYVMEGDGDSSLATVWLEAKGGFDSVDVSTWEADTSRVFFSFVCKFFCFLLFPSVYVHQLYRPAFSRMIMGVMLVHGIPTDSAMCSFLLLVVSDKIYS